MCSCICNIRIQFRVLLCPVLLKIIFPLFVSVSPAVCHYLLYSCTPDSYCLLVISRVYKLCNSVGRLSECWSYFLSLTPVKWAVCWDSRDNLLFVYGVSPVGPSDLLFTNRDFVFFFKLFFTFVSNFLPFYPNLVLNYYPHFSNYPVLLALDSLHTAFIVASLRHTCAIIILSNQHLDLPHLWGGMDYLGKGEVLTITDLDRFVNNIWEKCLFCVYRKCFRSLSSSHEKWEQKQKCCIYIFVQFMTLCIRASAKCL